jgi:hypothetical protein
VRVRLLLYGVVPLLLVGGMVAMYFSGIDSLREIVSPEFQADRPDWSREFGLLETLQNVALLALVAVAIAGLRRKRLLAERIALWVLLFGALFMFLEETDYGLHYVELLGGGEAAPSGVSGHYNIHRLGYTQAVMRNIAKFGMLTFFGGFAIVFAGSRNAVLRYVAPDRFSVLAILLVTALQELVWDLAARGPEVHGSLAGNEAEFAELGIYYIALLYAVDMVFWRTYSPAAEAVPDAAGNR